MELRIYTTEDGEKPFSRWLKDLRDTKTRAIIRARLTKVQAGLVLLLCGTDKGDQRRAIEQAIAYLTDWKQRGKP